MKIWINRQNGHAALLFALMVPVLFGVFTLGTDGARALQDRARLSEATEVASLALSAVDSTNVETQKKIFTDYVGYYFPLATVPQNSIVVSRTICNTVSDSCPGYEAGDPRYIKYKVTGRLTQKSWFPGNDAIAGFGETYEVASTSGAKKYQSGAIDVTYVVDHSSSMNNHPPHDSRSKFRIVKEIIPEINNEIEQYDLNNDVVDLNGNAVSSHIGYAAFNSFAHINHGSGICDRDYRVFYNYGLGELDYSTTASTSNIFNSTDSCRSSGILDGDVQEHYKIYVPSDHDWKVFYDNPWRTQWKHGNSKTEGTFYPLVLSSNFLYFDSEFSSFNASGCTNSVQGIIQGARIIDEALQKEIVNNDGSANANQLLIIVSDGVDIAGDCGDKYSSDEITTSLVKDYKLCENIQTRIQDYIVPGQGKVTLRIALIGFGYTNGEGIYANDGLTSCIDSENNIYEASSGDELKTAILGLISEEFGRLANN